ncbi:hypothetical protein BDW75DRAFT_236502 [Aspergillus navahoensis]
MAYVHIPPVTLEDLHTFQAKHFPSTLKPLQSPSLPTHDASTKDPYANADEEDVCDEDDDLGYYPDGVKRTLTDEQIRIFRHSEIHALLRERQIKQENEEYERRLESKAGAEIQDGPDVPGPGENKDGENELISATASPKHDAIAVAGRKRPANEAGSEVRASQPASKRKSSSKSGATSDVLLGYNESGDAPTIASQPRGGQAAPQFMGRKIISYDD